MQRRIVLLLAALLAACSAKPPANWARGGAYVDIPHARWVRGEQTVDIEPDGKILIDHEHQYTIDRAGRLFDADQKPVALLEPDGRVIGPDDESLGSVGSLNAARAGEENAWLTVTPRGEVIRYEGEGERIAMGAWVGDCARSASAHEVCVLVSHILGMKFKDEQTRRPAVYGPGVATPGVGVGVGVGFH